MKKPKSQVLEELRNAAVDEAKAVAFLEGQRWGNDPCCPHCGGLDMYAMMTGEQRNKDYRWRCKGCKKMFTVRTKSVLEETRLPLRVWVYAI
jgi:transposase-like protein